MPILQRHRVRAPEGHWRVVEGPPPIGDHPAALRAVLDSPPAYPGGEGSGVVYVGGGKYWPGIAVGVRMLRDLGCEWPVEVWHHHTEAVDPGDVGGMGVTFRRINEGHAGWESKAVALARTNLRRVLYLDADAYCVSSPCRLASLLDSRPFVFWSDMPNQQSSIKWSAVLPEIAPWGSQFPPVQGGQLLIDRERAWPLLAVLDHVCRHSDHYWGGGDRSKWLMYGDQDAWRVGLASGACGWRHLGPARWDRVAFVCEHEGRARFVHRCQGKLFVPEDAVKGDQKQCQQFPHLPYEREVFRHLAEVMGRKDRSSSEVFRAVYAKQLWGDRSGPGSSEAEAVPYLKILNALIAERGWESCLDVGCGDGRVAAGIAVSKYTGADVVPLFPGVVAADCYRDLESLPAADVLLCKDVIHHWSNAMVTDWLTRLRVLIAAGRWKAAVITADVRNAADGADTHLGGYRPLSPAMRPLAGHAVAAVAEYLHKAVLLMG